MSNSEAPHIIFILADDVGWSDFGYNNPVSPIPTPNIDKLASEGVKLTNLYAHALCTPSRASLLTGLYHVNTELTFVLTPGTPAGLPDDIPTLPMLLRDRGNYNTAMVGKWHLGHSQPKMTPTGRGFNTFTGMYMWDCDYETKQMSENAFRKPMMIDWVQEHANGSYVHYAEPLHSTLAITRDSETVITTHSLQHPDQPLFLYVPYTAAHSPLQPLPQHEAQCSHIPHLWRRQYCGLVVGFDEAVGNLTRHARAVLGDNLIAIVTSDNGGSPWFGGLNYPLKGAKGTPYEGGVKVPGLLIDYTPSQIYSSQLIHSPDPLEQQKHSRVERIYNGMMHFSDWLPTLLSYANIPTAVFPSRLDGYDFRPYLTSFPDLSVSNITSTHVIEASPRSEMLLEYMDASYSVFNESLQAYRLGKYKYISGITRDEHYYHESTQDSLNYTNSYDDIQPVQDVVGRLIEFIVRLGDKLFGEAHFDGTRISLVHVMMQNQWSVTQKQTLLHQTVPPTVVNTGNSSVTTLYTPHSHPYVRLYNLETDPYETNNLAYESENEIQEVLHTIQTRLAAVQAQLLLRPVQKVYLQYHLRTSFVHTFVKGNCSMNPMITRPEDCVFTHPWIPNDVNPWTYQADQIVNVNDFVTNELHSLVYQGVIYGIVLPVLLGILAMLWWRSTARRTSNSSK